MGIRLSGASAVRTADQNADINVTPFVDIMLVLLIIFMVSAPLATVSMKLDLPPPIIDGPQVEPVYVTVREDGGLFIGSAPTSRATLSADVCSALGGGDCRSERVFVRGDAGTRYGDFIAVMDGLNASGFTKVGLVNEDIS
ncbi:biopolymer transporter ExbD [Brevundimonas sp. NPDC092305]|uniref:biopolymer transporter ExbD n=1 Tax=Brevundimonas sp. NPDC092305 TaxID=3363957 RepID=UPI003822B900